MTGDQLAQAASLLVGAPFRLHGRDPQTGLDCVGLLEVALRLAGCSVILPCDYALRNKSSDRWIGEPGSFGLMVTAGSPEPGDVILIQCGPAQFHLVIAGIAQTWIHAHAGLRRVVVGDCPPGQVIRHWRPIP